MKYFYIVTNNLKDRELRITHSVMDYLEAKGCRCAMRVEGSRISTRSGAAAYRYTDPDRIPADTECILVLGGDGTLLWTATDTIDRQLPLLGINLGTLGYLAEVDISSIHQALDQLIRDQYEVEPRMLLKGRVFHEERLVKEEIALNDIVIRKEDHPGMIYLRNCVNHRNLNVYHADGMIISTPTGSTGYSLSVGGPIVSPNAEMFVMTPIAAQGFNTRSIVLPAAEVISVVIGEGRDYTIENAAAYFDGDTSISMITGDRVDVCRAEQYARFIKLQNDSFLEILRKKMSGI